MLLMLLVVAMAPAKHAFEEAKLGECNGQEEAGEKSEEEPHCKDFNWRRRVEMARLVQRDVSVPFVSRAPNRKAPPAKIYTGWGVRTDRRYVCTYTRKATERYRGQATSCHSSGKYC